MTQLLDEKTDTAHDIAVHQSFDRIGIGPHFKKMKYARASPTQLPH
jgi:hypothetical protein